MRDLLAESGRVRYGLFGTLILAVVYFIGISITLAMNATHLPEFLVLNIPPDQYYAYERYFIFPVALAGTILASGAIRLVSRKANGRGRFEDLFSLLGFSHVVIALVMGVPDLLIALLIGTGMLPSLGWSFVGPHVWIGTLWYLVLMILAVKEVERLSWGKSIVLALLGFVVNGLVQFIFIR
jgi:hypothetical protein